MNYVGNSEVLQIVEAVSREKGIPRDSLISAMENAIQVAGRRKYGNEHNIRAEIDRKTGEIILLRVLEVVEIVENTFTQITLEDALHRQPDAKIGNFMFDRLPPIDLGRIAAQAAKQVIVGKVLEAERAKQYEDFKHRKGEILSGVVKRIDFGNIIIDLGRTEAILTKDQQIKGEIFKVGDRIRAYVHDVRPEPKGPQIFLSRTANEMLCKLFEMEVPEIYDGVIEIRGVAREPGSKAKISVYTSDVNLDPVGACVGIKGNRVQSISNEIAGEKIDVILWDKNIAQFVINAMAPAAISKVVIDEDRKVAEIIVAEDQLGAAIGRKGQNVRLASAIVGWNIEVMTEDQESRRRTDEFNITTELFVHALDVEEVIAQLLCAEGFTSVEQVANVDAEMLSSINGLSLELAKELKDRAIANVNKRNEEIIERLETLGVEQELIDILALPPEYILKLAEYGVKTIEDIGELSVAEFKKLIPNNNISAEDIKALITYAKEYAANNNK